MAVDLPAQTFYAQTGCHIASPYRKDERTDSRWVISEFEKRFSSIRDYSTSLAMVNQEAESKRADGKDADERTEWPTSYLQDFIRHLLVYEIGRGIPTLPAVYYQAEVVQSWTFQRSRTLVEMLMAAYVAIEDSARRGEELRARVLGEWVASPNITMPPCFVALLSDVRRPEDIPEALIRLRRKFEPFRKLQRELEDSAANEPLAKFVRIYKRVTADIERFTAGLSEKLGEKPTDVPVLSTPLVQADLAAKVDSTSSSLGESISLKSGLMNEIVRLGLEGIEYSLLRRRLRPLHSIASKVFNAPLVPQMIERIWNVPLGEQQRRVLALCGQSRDVAQRLRVGT
jgi:hypothetical protein